MKSNDVNPILAAALGYIQRGFSVIPLRPKAKQPALKIAPYLSGEKRMSEDEARTYWTANPDAGVAIIMGAPSGLVAVDVDPRNQGDIEAASRDCPTGLVAQTGGGGLHLFLKHPGGRVPKGRTARPGVDRQSDGSYVVAPPSLHPETGKAYVWLKEGEPGSEIPSWVLNKREGDGSESGREWPADPSVEGLLANPGGILPGTQRAALLTLSASAAARGLSETEARIELRYVIDHMPVGDPRRPWTEDDIDELVTSAYAKFDAAGRINGIIDDRPGRAPREAGGEELRFLTYDELAAEVAEIAKRPWLVPGWLKARGLFLIAGPSHFGKTWVSIDLAVSVATGTPFLNTYHVDPGGRVGNEAGEGEVVGRRVLYIVGEDDAPEFKDRLDTILAAKGAHPIVYLADDPDGPTKAAIARARYDAFRANFRVHCDRRFTFGDRTAEAALLTLVKSFQPSLVILDPLKDLVRGEDAENFFARGPEYTRFLRDLRDAADCCVGLVHHTKKSAEWDAADAGISGRSEMIASFEHRFICFQAPIEDDREGATGLRWSQGAIRRRLKGSPPLDPVAIRYTTVGAEETILLASEADEEEARALIEGPSRRESLGPKILDVLAKSPQPLSARAIERSLKDQGERVSRDTVGASLKQLQGRGAVRKGAGGWSIGLMASGPEAQRETTATS